MTGVTKSAAPAFWRLLLLGGVVAALGYLGLMAPREPGQFTPIWLANAPVLACLLRSSPRHWWMWLAAGLAGHVAADLAAGVPPPSIVALASLNALEVALAAYGVRRLVGADLDPSRPSHLLANAKAAGAAAVACAIAAAGFTALTRGDPFLSNLAIWAVGDALGLIILTPCLLILLDWRRHLSERPVSPGGLATLAALVAVDVLVFAQADYPVSFMVPPAILLVGLTLEVFGAAVAVLITSAIAVVFTFRELGPLSLSHGGWTMRLFLLQVFLVVSSGLGLQVAALNRYRRRMREELETARQEAVAQAVRALQAQEQYRLLADKATDIISRTAVTGELIYLSPSVEAVTGYRPDEILGHPMAPQVHPEDQEHFIRGHLDLAAGRRAAGTPIRYRVKRKDGGWVWVEGNPSMLRDAEGRPLEFIDVSRDVTERVELEAKLETARKEAERAATVKSEFLANMSHEIRTPLTSILGFAAFLDEMKLADPAGRYVSRVMSASRTLLAVVNDILDFSKLEAGLLEIKPRVTDPAECARDVLELFAPQAEAKSLELSTECACATRPVMVDPDRLRQVLMNLVGNAVKFTQAGSVRLACAYDPERETLNWRVSDTGPGLDEAAQAKLFQRFSQVDGSLTRAHGGTGLGLAICKGLVEAMGGVLGVESRPGEGSTFWFEIPAPAAGGQNVEAGEALDAAALAGVRVLVADDNPTNLEIVRSLLTPLGLELTEASCGASAVEAARHAPFDLILMDLRMPGVDGWAAAAAIREGDGPNQDVPILAFSADVAPDRREAMGVFQDLVRKPIEPAELLRAILRWTLAPMGDDEEAGHAVA